MSNNKLTEELAKAQQEQPNDVAKDDEIDASDLDNVSGGLQTESDCKAMACGVF